ncbi:MAG: tetratricopeptide repeat protein, partial [Verrucomicrobiae bacterium]|nr:tetratricopeptide repeat protein [Verrucomicrobiae bacterium]
FQEGLARNPKDADLYYGLARAYEPTDSAQMLQAVRSALECNSNHIASILLLADHAIDSEDYTGAARLLERARAVNPVHAEAWAYVAVLGRLQNKPELERRAFSEALRLWPTNPRVPHLIGCKLSRKYRFAEGAEFQRLALKFDSRFLPAKAQLAEDLLRLGEEDEGWQLARQVHEQDGYNVTALNLVTLRDTLGRFAVISNEYFVVRMPAEEAKVYGMCVLGVLEKAREVLCGRYKVDLRKPVKVEIFSHQSDFAVRTFGLPENQGFLGVCFGPVITANSPAARPGRPFNWEAMLWHELCHAVTLQITGNKMPRWLSEGLSVYEERLANRAWGEKMNPRYREMILGGELVPLSGLSGAFLAPKSPVHLQFAYYESSLAVEFLVGRFGFESLLGVLRDVGEGVEIDAALALRMAPLKELETDFERYARAQAGEYGGGLGWERPPRDVLERGPDSEEWREWERKRPGNYWVLMERAGRAMEAKQWEEAKTLLKMVVERC